MSINIQFQHTFPDTQFQIDLELPLQGISALFGRSGAGKTTLINVISGLVTPDNGRIAIGDHVLFDSQQKVNLPIHQRKIGYVFQDARLFPHYSVQGNLLYGVKEKDDAYFASVTELLDIDKLLNRYPNSLSGGEKQRVAIARALLSKPKLLLMDEPLASLDLPRKREVMPFLEELSNRVQIPIIYVTHSLQEILRLAQHLVILETGKVAACDRLENLWSSEVMRPWQSFAEQSSLFEGVLLEHHAQYALSCIELTQMAKLWVQKVDVKIGLPIRLQIRASDVSITRDKNSQTSIRNILSVTVAYIEQHHNGDKESVTVGLALQEKQKKVILMATITQWALDDLQLKVGELVFAQIKGVSITQRDMVLAHS